MSIPSDRRSVSSILNNLIGRVRVLEALPGASVPSPVYMPGVQVWNGAALYTSHVSNLGGDVTFDTTAPNGMMYHNDYTVTIVGQPIIFVPVFIGQLGGSYGPTPGTGINGIYFFHQIARTGPDCPEYSLEIASSVVGGELLGVFDGALTWIEIIADDLYAAGSTWGDPYTTASSNWQTWYIELTGAPGDAATTWSSGSGALNGGPGLYYYRYTITGKNVSSSDYVLDLGQFGCSFSPA